MSKDAATEEALGQLHAKVARVMTRAIVQIEQAQSLYETMSDEKKEELGLIGPPLLSAPLMGVMTKFLADNSITCAPSQSAEVGGLEQALASKKEKRRQRVGNVVHLHETEDE